MDKDIEEALQQRAQIPWQEAMVEHYCHLGLDFGKRLELRISTTSEDRDVFALAQRAVNAFLTAFVLYPTSIAVHSTVAQLFEAAEHRFYAEPSWVKHAPKQRVASLMREFGEGFTATPIHVEIDEGLDIHTVAVRFVLDYEQYHDAIKAVLLRSLYALKASYP